MLVVFVFLFPGDHEAGLLQTVERLADTGLDDDQAVDREGLLKQLGIDMKLTESVLEDEGMHVFEWWGGEYRPLEKLIAEMDEVKNRNKM